MNKQGKVWGETCVILSTPLIEIHRIVIDPKTKCSTHCHRNKNNGFYCVSGEIEIHAEKEDYDLTDVTVIGPGMFTTIKPGEYHWFENNSDQVAEVLEIYYISPITSDIVRRDCGGKLK